MPLPRRSACNRTYPRRNWPRRISNTGCCSITKARATCLQQLHLSWPSNADIVQDLGWDLARLGEWKESAEYLDQAISLNPRDLFLRKSAVRGRLAMRDFATALRMLDDALRIWPGDIGLLGLKAQAFQATGQLDQAQTIVDRIHPGRRPTASTRS